MKKAFITGISGQDGYFLSQLLLEKKYQVHGLVRQKNKKDNKQIIYHQGDIINQPLIESIIKKNKFDEIYHLAALSSVKLSFENPPLTYQINIDGTLNIVEAVRKYSAKSKLYFAASSELFGGVQKSPQNEKTPFYPLSPYAISKLTGFWTIKNYREGHNLFMSNGILFNHESEMRGPEFVTRKISQEVAKIKLGLEKKISLGNLEVKRDWGYAPEYVEGMWRILQHHQPDDFVLATGQNHTIRQFVEQAFKIIGVKIIWEGKGTEEVGKNKKTGEILIEINSEYFRPTEVKSVVGDPSKAKKELGWECKTTFESIVEIMVKKDLVRLQK